MKQKFLRGQKVHVTKHMPPMMSHFECDFDGIVQYTHGQKYGGSDYDSYSLVVLDTKGKAINTIAWYHTDQLTLVDSDTVKGKTIIEQYKYGD